MLTVRERRLELQTEERYVSSSLARLLLSTGRSMSKPRPGFFPLRFVSPSSRAFQFWIGHGDESVGRRLTHSTYDRLGWCRLASQPTKYGTRTVRGEEEEDIPGNPLAWPGWSNGKERSVALAWDGACTSTMKNSRRTKEFWEAKEA